ncbi:MAG: type II secretion system protein GspE, partial [Candidatus Omnitrophota bacterium]
GLVPKEMCLQYLFIPIERIGDVLNVAIADPFNKKAIEAIQKSVPYKVVYTISTKTDIEKRVIREMR